jgi:hypothetical protein
MEKVGMEVVKQVGEHFLPADPVNSDKVLQDNCYTFGYRKMVAQHHIYFMDFV